MSDDGLGLEINLDALRAANVAQLDERVREVVEQKIKIADPPITRKLLIDMSERGKENEDVLSIRLLRLNLWVGAIDHDGATKQDLDRVRRFPQKKHIERTDEWIVAMTEPNMAHLIDGWKPGEYELTPAARMMFDLYFSRQQAEGKHLNDRAKFIAEGVAPDLDDFFFPDGLPPYKHQAVAISSGRNAEFFGYFMDPGTGKTYVEIAIACDRARKIRKEWYLANGGDAESFDANERYTNEKDERPPQFRWLIIAPKTVLRTWERELSKYATLDVNVERISGSKLNRAGLVATLFADRETPILVALINYDGLEVVEDFLKPADDKTPIWDRMTCDESIAIKNSETKRAKAVYRLAAFAKTRAILNGTPISKNVLDLYGQCHFLKPGMLGYTTKWAFDQYFGEQNFYGSSTGYKKEKLPELIERMTRNCYIIKRNQCMDLPERIWAMISPDLGEEQRSAYEQMAEEMIVDLEHVQAGHTLDTAEARQHQLDILIGNADESQLSVAQIVLVRMLRLAQITSGFMKMKNGSIYRFKEQPKLDALAEHLDSLHDEQRIVVWSRFREEIEAVVTRFKDEYGATSLDGSVKSSSRPDCSCGTCRECRLKAHETGGTLWSLGNRKPTRLIVIQPQTGGFGLNELIGSTDVNYLSNEWSLMLREQSQDRTHRIGVTTSVLYNDYVVPNTIDQLMYERIQQKRELAEMLTNPQNVINALKTQLAAMRAK